MHNTISLLYCDNYSYQDNFEVQYQHYQDIVSHNPSMLTTYNSLLQNEKYVPVHMQLCIVVSFLQACQP